METQLNKRTLISLASLCFILAAALSACHTTDKDNKPHCIDCRGHAPPVGYLTVYGKVHNVGVKPPNYKPVYEKRVLLIPHKYLCSDSTGSTDAIKEMLRLNSIKKSGEYSISISDRPPPSFPCYTASVIALDTTRKHPITYHYYRTLAGPKRIHINPASFHGKSPHDSVHVDFTLEDSTGH
jgi:hypothetical protein